MIKQFGSQYEANLWLKNHKVYKIVNHWRLCSSSGGLVILNVEKKERG